jgi:eukaryotic-like serine/threonine-protein kinase
MKFYAIISLIAITALAACSKKISDDTALTPLYQPAILLPTANNILYSINAATGEKNWEFHNSTKDILQTTPAVDNLGVAYLGSGNNLIAIDAKTGKEKWRKNYFSGNITYSILFNNDKLYFGTSGAGVTSPIADSFFCTDLNGTIQWRTGLSLEQPAKIGNGCIYAIGRKSTTSGLYCLSLANGQEIHALNTNSSNDTIFQNPFPIGTLSYSSPSYANNKVFATSAATKSVKCLKDSLRRIGLATSTAQIWNYTAGDIIYSSPVVYGDMVLVGSHDFNIHCIDANAGNTSIRWKYKTAERISSSACIDVANENVIMGSNDFNLYAINFVNGQLRWKAPTASMINSTAIAYKNKIYCTSLDKNLYCLNATDGSVIWKYNTNATITSGAPYAPSPMITEYNGTNVYPSTTGNDLY